MQLQPFLLCLLFFLPCHTNTHTHTDTHAYNATTSKDTKKASVNLFPLQLLVSSCLKYTRPYEQTHTHKYKSDSRPYERVPFACLFRAQLSCAFWLLCTANGNPGRKRDQFSCCEIKIEPFTVKCPVGGNCGGEQTEKKQCKIPYTINLVI